MTYYSEVARTARENGYTECAECAHTLEWDHTTQGCESEGCLCIAPWTAAEVASLRERYGLTAEFPKSGPGTA